MHNRSQLLGTADYTTPPASGRSSPCGGAAAGRENPYAPMSQRYVDDLEGQNDEHLEGLTAKVKILKDVRAYLTVHKAPSKGVTAVYRLLWLLGRRLRTQPFSSARWCVGFASFSRSTVLCRVLS